MKILSLSTYDIQGGASRGAYRLHRSLLKAGHESVMLVKIKKSPDPDIYQFQKFLARFLYPIQSRFEKKIIKRLFSTKNPIMHSPGLFGSLNRKGIESFHPDIVQMRWICDGFINPELLPKIRHPIVWTLSDAWAFAGAEHHIADGDRRYIEGYRSANRPDIERGLDISRRLWKRKRKAYEKIKRMVVVSPSKWLGNQAKESELLGRFDIRVIPNGLDTDIFQPVDRSLSRRLLGLPEDKKIVLFGSVAPTSDPNKGYPLIREALRHLKDSSIAGEIELAIFGTFQKKNGPDFGFPTHYLGLFQDELSMSVVYSACDLMVVPSLKENLPFTIMEAMACGVPVAAFDIGGNPDMVEQGVNGYLARPYEAEDLASGMEEILKNGSLRERMGKENRRVVLERYSMDVLSENYLNLYREILEGKIIR